MKFRKDKFTVALILTAMVVLTIGAIGMLIGTISDIKQEPTITAEESENSANKKYDNVIENKDGVYELECGEKLIKVDLGAMSFTKTFKPNKDANIVVCEIEDGADFNLLPFCDDYSALADYYFMGSTKYKGCLVEYWYTNYGSHWGIRDSAVITTGTDGVKLLLTGLYGLQKDALIERIIDNVKITLVE